ncbi:hypothetical protein T06_1024 [Trichinella sp. T6]|uniref:Secreted protein n=1 Tax=Trichinella murrelli TaxID=144512 RepID=A0A0V0U196_9BILA|nr:hypothetical protein T05_10277 [Trichinella murrelli]KRX83454.1 hypothetical protein T06_1024 [Trichinella sp. T6]
MLKSIFLFCGISTSCSSGRGRLSRCCFVIQLVPLCLCDLRYRQERLLKPPTKISDHHENSGFPLQ